VRRLAFLGVGSAFILGFGMMGAAPAFADNGVHYSSSNNMTVDRCAGCHRAHTAQASYLLKSATQTELCYTCHDGTQATTDVKDGSLVNVATQAKGLALRGGGFSTARIDSAGGVQSTGTIGVLAAASAQSTTSQHNVDAPGTIWGGGATGTGSTTTLECGSCHDPHGNGNYRILRPIGESDIAPADYVKYPAPASITGIAPHVPAYVVSEGTYTWYYDITVSSVGNFVTTNNVTIYDTGSIYDATPGTTANINGSGVTWNGILGAGVTAVSGNTITVSVRGGSNGNSITPTAANYTGTGGSLGYANSQGIAKATANGTVATYTTWGVHGLVTGQKIKVQGLSTAAFNGTLTVTVVDRLTFTATIPNTAVTVNDTDSKSVIVGIPDAVNKVYTTTNYWKPDDHNYAGGTEVLGNTTAKATAALGGPTAVISNISAWCSTCHTRLFAGSGAWNKNTGDATYTYMHRSNSGAEKSPNCLTCHVSHGSNASMQGDVNTQYSKTDVKFPNGTVSGADSFLLRVDNRGTCNMCHNL